MKRKDQKQKLIFSVLCTVQSLQPDWRLQQWPNHHVKPPQLEPVFSMQIHNASGARV